jgi:hypothetical protein
MFVIICAFVDMKMQEKNINNGLQISAEKVKSSGKNTRQLGRDRILFALDWVYRWGWSSPSVIDQLGGSTRRGLCAKLVKAELLTETKTASGAITEDIPSKFVTLTEVGISLVEKHKTEENLIDYPFLRNPWKVNQMLLRHDLIAQKSTSKNLATQKISDYKTPIEIQTKSTQSSKQPDCVWISTDNRQIAVEIEMTAKFARKLDEFVWGVVLALAQVGERPPLYDNFIIVSDSATLITRYKNAFKANATVNIWKKDNQSHWKISDTRKVPDFIYPKIMWLDIGK